MNLHDELKSLGAGKTEYRYDQPDAALLERFPNPYNRPEINPNQVSGKLNITCPEFTSLCPITGQPDFATIVIDMEPAEWCVESKSLKLYLGSFRMHGEFHEACICRICNDLVSLLHPKWIRVEGRFTPRGGIPLWPVAEWNAA
ncbi:preQ(1) synthase [Laribacter hongkongensis]|uniref:preQ(1) synthase n=1 Tax=Laribacter hongkongensis TaxID=168471 RepID=UPI001EFDDF6B|nr:preQ(1) synthase [Laribacter hongkongensis]MCG9063453.1 preQ(1) synthase [Laribacter hongkongensis]MCG9107654.1 preQ(1) synthase [Laribacter hongkongensis]